jgi:hypothetical protein
MGLLVHTVGTVFPRGSSSPSGCCIGVVSRDIHAGSATYIAISWMVPSEIVQAHEDKHRTAKSISVKVNKSPKKEKARSRSPRNQLRQLEERQRKLEWQIYQHRCVESCTSVSRGQRNTHGAKAYRKELQLK